MGDEVYLAERWAFEPAEFNRDNPGANAEITTADGHVHIAYVALPFAEHIVTLHNRTFGDGQDAPERRPCPRDTNGDGDCGQPFCPDCGQGRIPYKTQLYSEESPHPLDEVLRKAHADGSIFSDKGPAVGEGFSIVEEPVSTSPEAEATRAYLDGPTVQELNRLLRKAHAAGKVLGLPTEGMVRVPRTGLPEDLQPTARDARRAQLLGSPATADLRSGVDRLLQELVNRRVTEWLAREPARFGIDMNAPPGLLAKMLQAQGYTVFAPDYVFEVPPDWLLQINRMRENLAQDIAEQVPGAQEAADWFDTVLQDAEKPVDNVRRAFLAGYEAAAQKAADGINP